jgi:succinate dehydrogenase/fumarate reductase cytochrome b subunit
MLLKSFLAFLLTSILFAASIRSFNRRRKVSSFLQLLGAGCLVVVVLTHVFEALNLFPWMHWGRTNSPGHYLDLSSAVVGLTLLAVGYGLQVLPKR